MKTYRDLEIFQESKRLAIAMHSVSLNLPKFELYEEGSQLRRSSKSIPSMIVEGFARRRYKNDYIKHLVYAQGECDETLFHLEMLHETKSLSKKDSYEYYREHYEILGKRLNKFLQWTEANYTYTSQ